MEENKERNFIVINIDEDFCVNLVGVYDTLKEAKRQSEEYIIMLVEDGDFKSERSYSELKALGAGTTTDWYEIEGGGQGISWKYSPDDDAEDMIVILFADEDYNEDYSICNTRHKRARLINQYEEHTKEVLSRLKETYDEEEKMTIIHDAEKETARLLKEIEESN